MYTVHNPWPKASLRNVGRLLTYSTVYSFDRSKRKKKDLRPVTRSPIHHIHRTNFKTFQTTSHTTKPIKLAKLQSISRLQTIGLLHHKYLVFSAFSQRHLSSKPSYFFFRKLHTMSTTTASRFNPFSLASSSPLHSKPTQAIDPKGETRQPAPPTDPAALSALEAAKQLAAYVAVDEHILPHHRVIGIGFVLRLATPNLLQPSKQLSWRCWRLNEFRSGTTVPYVVERIVQQGHETNESR